MYAISKGSGDLQTCHRYWWMRKVLRSRKVLKSSALAQIIVINKKIVMSKNMDDGLISHSETSEQAEGISKMLWA